MSLSPKRNIRRRWRLWLLPMIGLLLSPWALHAAAPDHPRVREAPIPDWVDTLEPVLDLEPAEGRQAAYLLLDQQYLVSTMERSAVFTRSVFKIEARGALESWSSWTIGIAPEYQEVELHEFSVYRDGAWQDRLDTSRITVSTHEPDEASQIRREFEQVTVIPEDLQVGDVVSVAYSVLGQNPVFGGRYVSQARLFWGVHTEQARVLVRYPRERAIRHLVHGRGAEPPRLEERGDHTLLTWEASGIEESDWIFNAPPGYQHYPVLELSEFDSWAEVSTWAQPLYEQTPPREITEIAEQIAREHDQPRARWVAARDWVQGEVRYLALAIGEHSHTPYPAEEVLRRRYGDCKDKTVLLVALLEALGIEAHPLLVNTVSLGALQQSLPSPIAFDHVIVRSFVEGEELWADPTLTGQGGQETMEHVPAYGAGLPVVEGAVTLAQQQGGTHNRLQAVYVYEVPEDLKTAEVSITTVTTGGRAENERRNLEGQTLEDLQENYVEFYEQSGYEVEPVEPLQVLDEPKNNRIEITEQYRLSWPEGSETSRFETLPLVMASELAVPEADRSVPYGPTHPMTREEVVRIRVEGPMTFEKIERDNSTPWFDFTARSEIRGNEITITYLYNSKTDRVELEELAAYTEAVNEVFDSLAYEISDIVTAEYAVLAVLLTLAVLVLLAGLMVWALWYCRGRAAAWRQDRQLAEEPLFLQLVVRAGAAVGWLRASMAFFAFVALWRVWGLLLIGGGFTGAQAQLVELYDSGIALLAGTSFLVLLLTGFFFVRWYRHVLRALGELDRPGGAEPVGWATIAWIVPIANWFVPYQRLREAVRWSAPEGERRVERVLGLWWTGWVLYLIGGSILRQLESLPTLMRGWIIHVSAELLMFGGMVPLAWLAVSMVREVTGLQLRHRAWLEQERRASREEEPPAEEVAEVAPPESLSPVPGLGDELPPLPS